MELFKLLGTIAVENSEAVKALKETGQEGEHTEGKLSRAFGAIGKGAAVVGKAIATGLAVGAGACVGLATAAIKSYADYEQLVGGVETLFGTRGAQSVQEYADMVGQSVDYVQAEFEMLQSAQSLVMENAANAYKTAGLSANEYMESVNGIAAALNQSSASQLESAELANQAVIDMSDNAAKMGTSMEAIQNAYAGFSKQNYTMLDNLKLGYGGTKEEMERLLKDAEAISGIKYDISSFADVTQAIHVMQEEMGIAGTTAAEAAGTIQGSWGMLKGAWSNLLVGFSDPSADLQSLINNVFESVTTFAGNLIPRITQVFQGIATAFKELVPMIAGELPNFFAQVLPALVEGAVALVDGLVAALPGVISAIMTTLPMLIDGVSSIIIGIAQALPQIIQPIIAALPGLIQTIVDAIPALLPALIDGILEGALAIVEALPGLIQAIISALPTLIQPIVDALPGVLITILQAIVDNLPAIIEGLIQLTMAIVAALPTIIQALIDALPTIISLIVEALLTNLPLIIAGLVQVVVGIVAALPQIFMSLVQAIPAIFQGVWTAIKNVFSGVTEWFSNLWAGLGNVPGLSVMKTLVENVWNAMKNHISIVINTIKDVISTAWDAIKNTVSTAINAIKDVISTAWESIKTIVTNTMKLISSILKGDWEGIKTAISNILNAIKNLVTSIWNGIKSVISSVLSGIKSVVSTAWNGIKAAVSNALNAIKTSATTIWNAIKGVISAAVSGIWLTVKTGFINVKNAIINTLKEIPGKVVSIGKDIINGLWKGIQQGYEWLKGKLAGLGKGIVNTMKSAMKISSPSKVMRDEVGRWIAEGVAVGIEENTDKAESAAEKMSNAVLEAAEDRLEEYQTYNEMTLADEVGFWDEIRLKCEEGTDARLKADQKYFDAKKKLNDEIAASEETLQTKLDEIYGKIEEKAASLKDSFDLFTGFAIDDPMDGGEMFNIMGSQISALETYQVEIEKLRERIGDTELFKEIESMGVGALNKIMTLNGLSDYSMDYYLDMYNKRNSLANDIAESSLQDEALEETAKAYEEYADELSGLGVEIVKETEAMKTGAVDNLKGMLAGFTEALAGFEPKLKLPHFKIDGKFDIESGSVPTVSVEWFKKAMNNAMILDSPTIFGYNNGRFLGGGEAGSEVVAGTSTLMKMIQGAVAEQNGTLIYYLQKIIDLIATFFPEQIDAFRNMKLRLNTGVLVGELVVPMDEALGELSNRKDRGR